MRIMTGAAGNVWPFSIVINCCVSGKLSVSGGEKVVQGLGLVHATICKGGSRRMTGDTVFGILAIDHIIWGLSTAAFSKFCGYICLGKTVFVARPGIVGQMIGASEKQIAMT